ncbi:MAG: hypothetical protein JRF31_03200 [Deltaproteobacteria bacterium]|nr:hypothetical protein [Deltaproteobacteria bacterium]
MKNEKRSIISKKSFSDDTRKAPVIVSKIAFIVNPHAGNGVTESNWTVIEGLARDRLGHFETYMTQKPGDAWMFAKAAVSKGADLGSVWGGRYAERGDQRHHDA